MTLIAGSIEEGDVTFEYVKGHPQRSVRSTTSGMFFHEDTPFDVIEIIERCERSRFRIRIFSGDRRTGRSWLEEHGTMGTVGKSMGPMKIPILIERRNSMGGAAISTASIVRIQSISGNVLYQHPKFYVPEMTVVKRPEAEMEYERSEYSKRYKHPLTHAVLVGDQEHAAFQGEHKAKQWVEFMKGERNRPW